MAKVEVLHNDEIEQRYIIDLTRGLYLPAANFHIYHQAEIGSGPASEVISKFKADTAGMLTDANAQYGREIEGLFSKIAQTQRIKLRIRIDFDPMEWTQEATFTLKEKIVGDNETFKKYREHNIRINDILAGRLIAHIAPRVEVPGYPVEYGVLKHRYNIEYGKYRNRWDIDIMQGYNRPITLGEIEVNSTLDPIDLPPWAILRVNGHPDFKFLGTAELQEKPYWLLSDEIKKRYLDIFTPNESLVTKRRA